MSNITSVTSNITSVTVIGSGNGCDIYEKCWTERLAPLSQPFYLVPQKLLGPKNVQQKLYFLSLFQPWCYLHFTMIYKTWVTYVILDGIQWTFFYAVIFYKLNTKSQKFLQYV